MRLASADETGMTGRLPVPQQRRVLHPIPPTPTPLSGAIVSGSTGPFDLEGEVEAPCSVSLGYDEAVRLSQLPLPVKSEEPQKRNRCNTPPFHFSPTDLSLLSHSHCTHSLVVIRQVALVNILDFSSRLLFYCFGNGWRLSLFFT